MILTRHAPAGAMIFMLAGCESETCGEIPPSVEERFMAMRGPLGCEPSQSGVPDPPNGCGGADDLLTTARLEYAKLWADGGCGTRPPSLAPALGAYKQAFASEHDFVEHRITRGDFTIAAREFGAEHASSGPTIVLMHGFPDNQHLYDLVAPALGETHHTVTFDFVGWGESTLPPAGHVYTYDGLRKDLEAVLAHFNPRQVVPVVHDASGWPGIDWALENPDSVKALVLLNTTYHPVPGQAPPYVIRALSALDLRSQFIDAIAADDLMTRAVFRAQVSTFFVDKAREEVFMPLFEHFIPGTRAGLFGLTETLRDALVARAAQVAAMQSFPRPVSIAFGAEDPYLNADVARGFESAFAHSRLTLIEDAGHYVQLDRPDEVVVHIRDAAGGD